IQEKILSIFTPVRCLNEQQLQQYVDGNIPSIEKHLLQQHLVDCELCSEALEIFYQKSNQEKFNEIIPGIRRQIHKEFLQIVPVAIPAVKKVKTLKKEQLKEKLLIYSWTILLAAVCIGGLSFLIYHYNYTNSYGNGSRGLPVAARKADSSGIADKPAVPVTRNANPPGYIPAHNLAVQTRNADSTSSRENSITDVVVAHAKETPSHHKDSVQAVFVKSSPRTLKKAPALASTATAKKTVKGDSISGPVSYGAEHPAAGIPLKNDTDSGDGQPVRKAAVAKQPAPDSGENTTPQTDPDEILYTSAKNYLAQGNVESAMSRFKFLATNAGNKYYQQAKFQLALCYKAKGKTNRARKLLKEIADGNGSMKVQAEAELANLQ
ncbi:MAG TPA: hypothetical protein VIU45_03055, partial [Chitinophagaceae bacterium]